MAARNVVLVTVDALRADHLGCYGYERRTSSNIDALVGEFAKFDPVYSPSSNTREAVSALLTGRYPDRAIDAAYELAAPTLAADFADAGYATAGFHSNPFVSRAFGYGSDFDTFDDDLHLGRHRLVALAQRAFDKLRNRHYARAEEINTRSLAWLDSIDDDRPVFLWNHYMDVHGPYEPPDEYRTLFADDHVGDRAAQRRYRAAVDDPEAVTDDDRATLVDLYDAEIRYFDDHLRTFLDELDERGRLENAIVIVTADHGDAFGEHGYFEHPPRLHDELVAVPLLAKGVGVTGVVDATATTLDVAATLREVAGVERPGPGRPLDAVATADDRTVFSQARGIGDDTGLRRYAARDSEACARAEYDVESGELTVLSGSGTELIDELREHVAERTGDGAPGDVGGQDRELREAEPPAAEEKGQEAEVRRRLDALGYTDE